MTDHIGAVDAVASRQHKVRRIRFFTLGLIISGLLLALGIIMFVSQPVDIRISEAQAQTALNSQVGRPLEGALSTSVTPEILVIDFLEDDRVQLTTTFDMKGFAQTGLADGILRAGLRYHAPYIYLRDIDVSDLSLSLETDSTASERARDIATVLKDRFRREKDATQGTEAGSALDRLARDAAMELAGRIPIYDLRDAGLKGSVAALALDSVRFENDTAILTLSSRRALLRILACLGVVALVLGYFLVPLVMRIALDRAIDATVNGANKNGSGPVA